MIFRSIGRFAFSRLSQNLKTLSLKYPTTQQQIKNRYRQLAKQYHPDTLKQNVTKQSEDYFVKITTAYNFLKEIQQKQLTGQNQNFDSNMPDQQKQKVKTKQEELRQETYDYFRKKQFYAQKKKDPSVNKPLHKTIPQLFIGTVFVIILFSEWIYKTMIKTNQQFKESSAQKQHVMLYQDVFKGFNAAKKFNNSPQLSKRQYSQVLSQKQNKNLAL